MGVEPVERDRDRIGREALRFDLSAASAVDGIREVGAEALDVEVRGPAAHLFVGSERDPDTAVLDLRVSDQMRGGRDDLRDACFVVGPQERRSRGGDDVVAHLLRQRGIVGEAQDGIGVVGKDEIAAIVSPMHDRSNACAAHLRGCVHVSDEADGRHVRGGNGRGFGLPQSGGQDVRGLAVGKTHYRGVGRRRTVGGRARPAVTDGPGAGITGDDVGELIGSGQLR